MNERKNFCGIKFVIKKFLTSKNNQVVLFVVGIDGHAISISNLVDIRILSNRELAMRVDGTELMRKPDGSLKHTFYTDLNGFQMQARHFYSKLPLQANFYPMPTKVNLNQFALIINKLSQKVDQAAFAILLRKIFGKALFLQLRGEKND